MYLKNFNAFTFLKLSAFLFIGVIATSCSKDEDPDAQINAEVNAIDEYLDANVTDPVLYDQSGMRMVIQQIGNNATPKTGQTVKFNYNIKLFSTGVVIENGTMNAKLEDMPTDGLRYSLTAMMGGSRATFYVPSKYAYGETGKSNVPSNSTLVYEIISPIEVIRTSAEQTQFTSDTTAIRQYFGPPNNITNAIKLPSGVWYTIDAPGTGKYPTPYDNISFGFKGTVMSNGFVFQQESTLNGQSIFGLIDGLKVGLPHTNEGSAATFYIPSGLGYGVAGAAGIPANANIIFKIQLSSVTPYFE